MLPKNQRIPRKMFPLLSKGAKVFKNNLFLLRFVSKDGPSRFCLSVSKKVSKSAVVRNGLRRAGYKAIREHIAEIRRGIIAVLAFRVVPKTNEEIIKSIESILKESKLIL